MYRLLNLFQVNSCNYPIYFPIIGFFTVTVIDPLYSEQPLFEYDIGVSCPQRFKVDFKVPTRGSDNYDKRYRVQLHDTYRTIHMNVLRPAPNMTKETYGMDR